MENEKQPAVYILANRCRGTLYVGVTSSLWSRVWDHKNGTTPGFTSRYGCKTLVWYEHHHFMDAAIKREKQLKAWQRDWKIKLIEFIIRNGVTFMTTLIPSPHSFRCQLPLMSSCQRRLASSFLDTFRSPLSWTPASAGVTEIKIFTPPAPVARLWASASNPSAPRPAHPAGRGCGHLR